MAAQLDIPTILQIARISEYLAGNKAERDRLLKGNFLDQNFNQIIYLERRSIQYVYDRDPNDPNLRNAANYLFDLLGPFAALANQIVVNQGQAPPTISNPANQAVGVGDSATFSVTVNSALPYTLQWYLNGQPIAGATGLFYTFLNAQLTDSNDQFFAIATSAIGSATSLNAILTVSVAINVNAWYGDDDPYANLQLGLDNLVYQVTQPIQHNQPYTIVWPAAAANNKFEVTRVPVTETAKTTWFNTQLNQGSIPDSVFRPAFVKGNYLYTVSRNAMSLDGTNLTETFS